MEKEPIVVSENAGVLDLVAAAGRYVVVVLGAVPALQLLLGNHDFVGMVRYFQSAEGSKVVAAASALFALGYGLYKSHKRGNQIATVAADPKVPESIATTK